VAIGWLYLYSRYRKVKRQLRERDNAAAEAADAFAEAADDFADLIDELCDHCGHPQYKHADDEQRTCPTYIGHDDDEEN